MNTAERREPAIRFISAAMVVAWVCCLPAMRAKAGTYYWDANGSTAGAGASPSGTWGADAFWNSNSAGNSGTFITSPGSDDSLYFVAGPAVDSGANAFTVSVSGTQVAKALTFQAFGAATLSGSTVNLSGGGITVSPYAYGIVPTGPVTISTPLALQAAQTWTNNSSNGLIVSGAVTNGGKALAISGPGNTTISGTVGGTGSLTKIGQGSLTLTGSATHGGDTTLNGGALVVASSGSLSSAGGNLYVGKSGPAALTIQDDASVSVGGELNVNYQHTSGVASVLTLQSGSLAVGGQTYIGRAAMRTGPSTTNAAVYQSGGTATLTGQLTVGYAGTATSLYDINGGTLNANGGMLVGRQGNGLATIDGSAVVNVGSSGLVIGQDSSLTTGGSVSLAGGELNIGTSMVSANLTLGSNGGLASFTRSGGTMYVKGDLLVGGIATLTLNGTNGSVATSFGNTLTRVSSGGAPALGLLVIVPYTGDLGDTEAVSFGTVPTTENNIVGPWVVGQTSGTDTAGDYLTVSSNKLAAFAGYHAGFSGAGSTSVVSVSGTSSTNSKTIYAMKVSGTATINSDQTLTVSSGGMILGGGTIEGGSGSKLAFGCGAMIYAGSDNPGTISSAIQTSGGLVKFGLGSLVLSGDNSQLIGGIIVGTGTLNVRNPSALGPGGAGNNVVVAAGASLEIQGGIVLGSVPVTINGAGVGGSGALRNVRDDNGTNNQITGTIILGSDAQIDTAEDTMLTLSGGIQTNTFNLRKTGMGTLALSGGSSAFLGTLTVAEGTLALQHGNALGSGGGGVVVNSGAALALQGGVSIPAIPLTIGGAGSDYNGVLQSQGINGFAGPVTLVDDSVVNVSSGSLSLSGNIGGSYGIVKVGAGTLVLVGANTFTEAMSVLEGALSLSGVNNAGSHGPLGAATSSIVLGSGGKTATLQFTGAGSAATDRMWTLAAGGSGAFQVDESAANLTLSGAVSGSGGLKKTGSGTLTLSAANTYTGATNVSGGTLAISASGSVNGTSSITVGEGAVLRVAAGLSGDQLPNAASISLSGGRLDFRGNGAVQGESLGSLALGVGHSNVTAARAIGAAYAPYLRFAGGPAAHTTGATVNFYSDANSQIQFQADPPALVNGIIGGYAFFSDADLNGVDFATISGTGPYTVSAYSGYTGGDLGTLSSDPTANVKPSGSQTAIGASKTFNSLNLTGSVGVTISTGCTLTLNSGGLIGNTIGGISGGTLSGNGELVVNAVQALTITSAIGTGTTALVKTGPAKLTLTSTTAIPSDNIYLNQGTLEYAPAGDVTYGGVISGAGSLLKSGTATLTLSGNNTYTGATTVAGGALAVNGSLAAGSAVTVHSGATLSGNGTIGGNVTVSGGTIALGSSGNIAGTVTAASGALTIGQNDLGSYLKTAGGVTIGGSATITAGASEAQIVGSLNYTSSADSTFSGRIAGSGKTVLLDSPVGTTLLLSGPNSYSGGTAVESGTLKVGHENALGNGGLWIGENGTLDLNGRSITLPSLDGITGATITDNATTAGTSVLTVDIAVGTSTFFGDFLDGSARNVELVKDGEGTLAVGVLDLRGDLAVSEGSLIVSYVRCDTLSIGPGARVIVREGGGTSVLNLLDVGELSQGSMTASPASAEAAAVPEPGSLVLLLAGSLAGLLAIGGRLNRVRGKKA